MLIIAQLTASQQQAQNVLAVTAATLALGVVVGGLIFASRFLWRLLTRLVGGATWTE
jgi:hypothetical protein